MDATRQKNAVSLRIDPSELLARMKAGEPVTILDVRSQKAWESSQEKIPGAVRVDKDNLEPPADWPRNRLTVAYCT
jgi:rhodanese-related sulfurtransferase